MIDITAAHHESLYSGLGLRQFYACKESVVLHSAMGL